jgi:hypothetical protein
MQITGLSETSVLGAIKALISKGLIYKTTVGPAGKQQSFYELVVEDSNNSYPPSNCGGPPQQVGRTPPVSGDTKENTQNKISENHHHHHHSPAREKKGDVDDDFSDRVEKEQATATQSKATVITETKQAEPSILLFTDNERVALKAYTAEQIAEAEEITNKTCVQRKNESRVKYFFKTIQGIKSSPASEAKRMKEAIHTAEEKNKLESTLLKSKWKSPENTIKCKCWDEFDDTFCIDVEYGTIDPFDGKKRRAEGRLRLKYSEKGYLEQLESFLRKHGFTRVKE